MKLVERRVCKAATKANYCYFEESTFFSKARLSMYEDDSTQYKSATTVTEMTATLNKEQFSFRVGGKE